LNIVEKKLENAQMELEIEVPADQVAEAYKTVFAKIQKNVKVDGFRKGKVPMPIVEQRYQNEADQEAIEALVQKFFFEAINETQMTPIDRPYYDFNEIKRDQSFTFKAVFDVMPSVEIGKYIDIAADETVCKVSDDDVMAEIDTYRERMAVTAPKTDDETIENGDMVKIKVKRLDHEPTEEEEGDGSREYTIVVGKSKDSSALDKHIVGMKKDEEKEVEVKYPKDYYIEDLAGQKVKYNVHALDIQNMDLPELNDEFVKQINFETVDDMKVKVREQLEQYVDQKTRGDAKSQIIRAIVESSTYDIPKSMIMTEMGAIFKKTQQRVGYYADDIEQFAEVLGIAKDEFEAKLMEEAELSIQTTLTLSDIAREEKLEVNEEQYNKLIESWATQQGQTKEQVEEVIKENNSRENIEHELLLDSAMDFIYEKGKIKKSKAITLEEYLKAGN